jgi:hypothetical protein
VQSKTKQHSSLFHLFCTFSVGGVLTPWTETGCHYFRKYMKNAKKNSISISGTLHECLALKFAVENLMSVLIVILEIYSGRNRGIIKKYSVLKGLSFRWSGSLQWNGGGGWRRRRKGKGTLNLWKGVGLWCVEIQSVADSYVVSIFEQEWEWMVG